MPWPTFWPPSAMKGAAIASRSMRLASSGACARATSAPIEWASMKKGRRVSGSTIFSRKVERSLS